MNVEKVDNGNMLAKGHFPTFVALQGRMKAKRNAAWQGAKKLWKRSRRTLGVLLLLAIAAHIAANIWASILLNRELAAIRNQGAPLTMSELASPPIPDERNAASLYRRAFKSLTSTGAGFPIDISQPSRNFLQKNQESIALVRQAAARPECSFPVKWDEGVFALFPHLAEMRNLARLMATQAVQESRDGRLELALRDIQVIFRMSGHGSEGPVLIDALVSRAIESIAYQALAEVLKTNRISVQQARQIAAQLPHRDWQSVLARALRGERAMGLWSFEALRRNRVNVAELIQLSGGDYSSRESSPLLHLVSLPLLLFWSPLLKFDEVYYLRLMQRNINRLPTTLAAAPSRLIPDPGQQEVEALPLYAFLTRTNFPVYSRIWTQSKNAEVERGLAEAALAIAAYRSSMGQYPARLKDAEVRWGSTLPLDPYSGHPFIYRREADSFTLYSVGEDQRDDGGKAFRPAVTGSAGEDIPWLRHR
jgi:hypothetical protein